MAPKKIGIELITKTRKRTAPRSAFSKDRPSPAAFKPGESGCPGGKPKEGKLLSRSIRVALADRCPKAICEQLGMSEFSSWAQVLAQALLRQALRGDTSATKLILEASEYRTGMGFAVEFGEGESSERPVLNVVFTSSDGNGSLSEESRRMLASVEEQFSDDALDPRTINGRLLGPES